MVLNGRDKNAEDITDSVRFAREAFENHGCTIMATIVNRVNSRMAESIKKQLAAEGSTSGPVYILPEDPLLSKPTVGEIAKELEAPLGTVKAQLHRARELMYDLVKGKKEHI